MTRRPNWLRPRGMTLVESAVCVLLVGGLFVAALTAVGAVYAARHALAERASGHALAQELAAEALRQPYGGERIGLEGTEAGPGRSGFDDADDYHGWTESPAAQADGTPLPGGDRWQRSVVVEWVKPSKPAMASPNASGAKRVTVTAARDGRVVATVVAVRTRGWPDARTIDPLPE